MRGVRATEARRIVMPKTTQLVLNLESKPGVLAKLARTLADAGVNMTALCASETAGRGKIRLLVGDPARAKEALKTAKYRVSEEQAVTVLLENRPGTFAAIAEKLEQARINIKCAYVTGDSGSQLVVLSVANADKAQQALGA
jgi:hypothetical protein